MREWFIFWMQNPLRKVSKSVVGGMKALPVMSVVVMSGVAASAYDFKCRDVYYNVVSSAEMKVEVACGNPGADVPQVRGLLLPECDGWPGNSYSGEVIVPEEVDSEGKVYSVVGVGKGAFVNCPDLTSVVLPESVTYLGNEAFEKCNSLVSIVLPDNISQVGYMAFSGCSKLGSLDYPSAAELIPDQCFEGTGSEAGDFVLSGIGNVKVYGPYAFLNCAIHKLDLEDTAVESLGINMFHGSGIEELVLPSERDDAWFSQELGRISGTETLKVLRLDRNTPPVVDDESIFSGETYANCRLEVPEESLTAYSTAPMWRNFKTIVAIKGAVVGNIKAEDSPAEYYNLQGIRLPDQPTSGIYVERRGADAKKVIR